MPYTRIRDSAVVYTTVGASGAHSVVVFSESDDGREQIDGALATVGGHGEHMYGLCLTPREQWIIGGGFDSSAPWVWHTADLSRAHCLDAPHSEVPEPSPVIHSVDVSFDGKHLLGCCSESILRVWDLNSGECQKSLKGHQISVTSGVFSPNGEKALSGAYDKTLKLWDIKSEECQVTFEGHSDIVWDVQFSSDGKKALSGSYDKTVKVWDIERKELEMTLEGHTKGVNSVRFSVDGKTILSTSSDTTIKLWSADSGKCTKTLTGHTDAVNSAVFSPDESLVISSSADATVKVWNVQTGECVRTFVGHKDSVGRVCVSRDGKTIYSCSHDTKIKMWSIVRGTRISTLTCNLPDVDKFEVSTDGSAFSAISGDGQRQEWLIGDFNLPNAAFLNAFASAMARGSVIPRSIKVLFLGATRAGKTALVAALRGDKLPGDEDRSLATRMYKVRMTFDEGMSKFETVPLDESRLAGVLSGETEEEEGEEEDEEEKQWVIVEEEEGAGDYGGSVAGPSAVGTGLHSAPRVTSVTTTDTLALSSPASTVMITTPATSVIACPSPATSSTADDKTAAATAYPLSSPATATLVSASTGCPPPPTDTVTSATSAADTTPDPVSTKTEAMKFVRSLFWKNKPRGGFVDMDTFDFAGESMYDSLPALFMGSESLYVIVFDLSVMRDTITAARQYEHISKWAHIIARQVPTSPDSYFRVILVGTHVDTFPGNTFPSPLLSVVSAEVRRRAAAVLGHVIMPDDDPHRVGVPFFQVGSRDRIGLSAVSKAMYSAVRRNRRLPMEWVAAQDLIGRWARLDKISLMSGVSDLRSLVLNESEPRVTLGSLLPNVGDIRAGLVPYLESAAEILVCRADASSSAVCDTDTIVFDVPQLIAALELLCSVVMARWKRAKSKRALAMLEEVIAAGFAHEEGRVKMQSLLDALDAAGAESECGFPVEVAEWLVWKAASSRASEKMTEPMEDAPSLIGQLFQRFSAPDEVALLAGANVSDVDAFMASLERLSLVFRRDKQLFVPMLLPESAAFSCKQQLPPVLLFLYQFVDGVMLPVSLATFHLLVVSLWRESLPDEAIRATQRCTDELVMTGCSPVRVRLDVDESFVRIEVMSTCDVWHTVEHICTRVCDQTRSLRWGWRGQAVVVPAHPYEESKPLFPPDKVAQSTAHYRLAQTVNDKLKKKGRTLLCNESLAEWWVKTEPEMPLMIAGQDAHFEKYTHAAALVVGVSTYSKGQVANQFEDLPGVVASAEHVSKMWRERDFAVKTVVDVDEKGVHSPVTHTEIKEALLEIAATFGEEEGGGKSTLLVVHLIGHGAGGRPGGLVLSDAFMTPSQHISCFNLSALRGVIEGYIRWRGCNVLVIGDFCNSGSLVEEDLERRMGPAMSGHARQMLASSLPDSSGYMTVDEKQTCLTEVLVRALGSEQAAFHPDERVISLRTLRSRLPSLGKIQTPTVGRIYREWGDGTAPNDGDILFFRRDSDESESPIQSIGE